MSTLEKVRLARRAGRVNRYHGQYLSRPENVAEHTFGVLSILAIMTNGQIGHDLMLNALFHDGGEYISGDIPSPVKGAIPGLRAAANAMEKVGTDATIGQLPELTEWEYKLLKVADNLDGLMKCTEERDLGNYTISEPYAGFKSVGDNYADYLKLQLEDLGGGPIAELVQAAITQWHWKIK